jgi:hypothetical protein
MHARKSQAPSTNLCNSNSISNVRVSIKRLPNLDVIRADEVLNRTAAAGRVVRICGPSCQRHRVHGEVVPARWNGYRIVSRRRMVIKGRFRRSLERQPCIESRKEAICVEFGQGEVPDEVPVRQTMKTKKSYLRMELTVPYATKLR